MSLNKLRLHVSHGVAEKKGKRPSMEDKTMIVEQSDLFPGSLYGVFDGHGGDAVSIACVHTLQKEFANLYNKPIYEKSYGRDVEKIMKDLFVETDNFVSRISQQKEGSTAGVVHIDNISGNITSANIGDTEIILGRKSSYIVLSEKHTVKDNHSEVERIEKAGGFCHANRVMGYLTVTRAFGDQFLKTDPYLRGRFYNSFITSIPHTYVVKLEPERDLFFIIASDGVWDTVSKDDAYQFVLNILIEDPKTDPNEIANKLVELAMTNNSKDNCSAIVGVFKWDKK